MERNNTSDSGSADTSSSDFVLQWGNRKRLRCMKVQAKDHSKSSINSFSTGLVRRATTWIDGRVVRPNLSEDPNSNPLNNVNASRTSDAGNGCLNLRQRPSSSSNNRMLRNLESSVGMRGCSNGRKAGKEGKKGGATGNNNSIHHHNNKNSSKYNNNSYHNGNNYCHQGGGGGGGSGPPKIAHDGKDSIIAVWPPKFVIALTNKEKEEDFMAIKGSKLPQRPKKRAKCVQRTVNLVSPGSWLCDLTLERYEIREKKVSKKRPRRLKALGNMESDSE